MTIVLSGTPGYPGEGNHEVFPHRAGVFQSGVQRRWAVIVLVVSTRGRSSGHCADQAPTHTVSRLRGPRCREGRHRRRPQTVGERISETLGKGRRFGWVGAVLTVMFIGLRWWARRRVVHWVLTPYLC